MSSNVDVDNYRLNQYKVETIEQPNGSQRQVVQAISAFTPPDYDKIELTYVAAGNGAGEIETVTYKLATVTQVTLTLGYDVNNKLSSVEKS